MKYLENKTVTFFCPIHIYRGLVEGIVGGTIILQNVYLVEFEGDKLVYKFLAGKFYLNEDKVESYGEVN